MPDETRIFAEEATGQNSSGLCHHRFVDVTDQPMPTVMAGRPVKIEVKTAAVARRPAAPAKPPFHVPSMDEINAIPWNGLTVVSTFSGTGGSCLGYRMAGYRVLWANEFVPEAQRSYKANAVPGSIMDGRDIKLVKAEEILDAIGMKQGEISIFDGSPPCQAFSTAGSRERGWGKDKSYAHGAKQKNETLFDEYIRLLRGLMPKVFIAENVSGLVKGTAKGFFLEILAELKASGYRVEAKLLDAQWLGVPQARQRIIFQGVRNDLSAPPAFPKPLPYRYSVRDALPWIGKVQVSHDNFASADRPAPTILSSDGARSTSTFHAPIGEVIPLPPSRKLGTYGVAEVDPEKPCPTVTIASPDNDLAVPYRQPRRPDSIERRKFTIAELKPICGFPDSFILTGGYADQWARLGNSVPPGDDGGDRRNDT